MRNSAILLFANKQDLVSLSVAPLLLVSMPVPSKLAHLSIPLCMQPGAYTTAEVTEAFKLHELKGRKWHVQSSVATRYSS